MSIKSQQLMVWWAIVFLSLFGLGFVALIGFVPPPSATLSPAEIAIIYSENSFSIRLGAAVCVGTGGFMLPLAAVVSIQMARFEKGTPVWAILQGLGGAMMSMWLVLPPIFWGVAAFTPERMPEVTALMHELSFLTLVTTIPYFIFQILAVSYICFKSNTVENSPFPRWFGYFSLWTCLLTEVGVVGFLTKTGPFAWNGMFVFWLPIAVFSVWFLMLAYLLLRSLKLCSHEKMQ